MKKNKALFLLLIAAFIVPLACRTEDQIKYEDVSGKKETIIKKENGDKAEYLINPARICIDSKENIFILEPEEKCVKKYSNTGKFLLSFGRAGDGPGEIKSCYSMKIDNKDNIVLYDESRGRLIKFNNEGKFADETNVPFSFENYFSTGSNEWYIEKTKEGTFLNNNGKLNILSLYSSDLKIRFKIDSCNIKDMKQLTNPRVGIENPYYAKMVWSITNDNIWVAFTGEYSVKIYSLEGKLIRSFTGKADRTRVTEKDKKTYFDQLRLSDSGGQSQLYNAPDWLVKATEFPAYKPMISGMLSDLQGNVLIMTSNELKGKSVWDLFAPDGTLIKKILIPAEANDSKSCFNNGHLYTIGKINDGTFTVERYEINVKK